MKKSKIFVGAAVACIIVLSARSAFASPVIAHADAAEFAGLSDYLTSSYAVDGNGALGTAWGVSGYAAYNAALWTVAECMRHPISGVVGTADTMGCVSGQYYYQGELYPLVCVFPNNNKFSLDDGGIILCSSPLFELRENFAYSQGSGTPSGIDVLYQYYGNVSSYINISVQLSRFDGYNISGYQSIVTQPSFTPISDSERLFSNKAYIQGTLTFSSGSVYYDDSSIIAARTYFDNASSSRAIAGGVTMPTLPSSGADPMGIDYIINTLNPYYVENYPDIEPYIYAPTNWIPEYPTDYVTGIPKDWTITNPQLPSITHKRFTFPEFSWDSLDLSGLSQYTQGVGFWWALLGKAFNDFSLMPVALLVLALAVVGFILWNIGG